MCEFAKVREGIAVVGVLIAWEVSAVVDSLLPVDIANDVDTKATKLSALQSDSPEFLDLVIGRLKDDDEADSLNLMRQLSDFFANNIKG